MGYGFKVGGSLQFKATINVQANANVKVALSLDGTQVASQTVGSNGYASFIVKKKGTYTVASPARSATVSVTQHKGVYTTNIVYVSPATNLTAYTHRTGIAGVYWTDESSYRTGSIVRYSTSTYPTTYNGGSSAFGIGSSKAALAVSNGNTQYGFTQSISSGTIYWTRFNYLTVNGTTYYSAYDSRARAYNTYVNCAGTVSFTSGASTWTVPTGVRYLTVGVVGGGGSGGASSNTYYRANGGGGGGYVNSAGFNVTPGQVASYNVGSGGAAVANTYADRTNRNGNAGGTTVFSINGSSVSASGGAGGGHGGGSQMPYGGNGGAGGGAGGSSTGGAESGASGGNGGSNGGNGGSVTYGSTAQGGTGAGQAAVTFNGTIYSGGGGGGRGGYGSAGSGGSPAGGSGGAPGSIATSGSNGSGGGGGGAGTLGNTTTSGAWTSSGAGGSGTVIIIYS